MGNYISCTLSGPNCKNTTSAVKVVFPSGELRRLKEPTKAAELMLENPNSFLVNTKSLQIGKRFCALSADEDLEVGNVYVFFPMKRVNGVITAADMGALFLAAKRVSHGTARISPECGGGGGGLKIVWNSEEERNNGSKVNLDEIDPDFSYRLSMCRSKKPLLETIVEEQVSLRLLFEIES